MKYIHLFTFCFLVLFFGCKKNIDEVVEIDPFEPPTYEINYDPIIENINSSVLGLVIDEAGNPVEGATVTLNLETITTDIYGTFRFKNTMMNKQGTFIKIEKDGYFESGRKFFPQNAETNNIKVELLEKKFDQSFQSSSGASLEFDNGGHVKFSSNSIRMENGDPYSGEVKVALKWLDPTASKTFDQMPGALLGVNLEGEEVALETYGMIAVELESPSGDPLNIAYNQTAEIKMPIPATLVNNAPTEIPLWSFNYKYGVWAKDGKALLQNGFYVGEVSHFSFWNCDYPRPLVNFNLTLIDDETSEPMQNVKVAIYQIGTGLTRFGYTNTAGELAGKIPAYELLEMHVKNGCDDLLLDLDIGPFSDDIDFGNILVNTSDKIFVHGDLVDCNGELVNDGMLLVKIDENLFSFEVNSNPYGFWIPYCENASDVQVSGGDFSTFEQGEYITLPIQDSINVGSIVACGQTLVNYVKMTINSTQVSITPLTLQTLLSFNGDWLTQLTFGAPNSGNWVEFGFLGNTAGDYSNIDLQLVIAYRDHSLDVEYVTTFDEFIVDEYGDSMGEIISGHASGNQYNQITGDVDYVEIEYKVIRDF
ncbi:MAG: carboxypeptidase-like regulatory domain-containing protein [Saprospiraceae bacterium]